MKLILQLIQQCFEHKPKMKEDFFFQELKSYYLPKKKESKRTDLALWLLDRRGSLLTLLTECTKPYNYGSTDKPQSFSSTLIFPKTSTCMKRENSSASYHWLLQTLVQPIRYHGAKNNMHIHNKKPLSLYLLKKWQRWIDIGNLWWWWWQYLSGRKGFSCTQYEAFWWVERHFNQHEVAISCEDDSHHSL